jgi:hypothetical protein
MGEQFLAKNDVRSPDDVGLLAVEQRLHHRGHMTGTAIPSFQADWSESAAFAKAFRIISAIVAFITLAIIIITVATVR